MLMNDGRSCMTVFCLSVITASTLMAAPGAHAQEASSGNSDSENRTGGLEEVVVTAEKKTENAQRTPISLVALSGEDLSRAQIRTLTDLQSRVPDFRVGENDGYAQLAIRGIGSSTFVPTGENSVAVNQNEIYVSRPIAQMAGFYDISSVEVLKGPQGTLYGRNATAGSVNITTTKPTEVWSGYVRGALGNYDSVNVEGAVGGPIVGDKVMFRVAGYTDRHSGFGKNVDSGNDINDKDARGVRATLLVRPFENLTATLIADYNKENDHGAALHYFGATGFLPNAGALGAPPLFITLGGSPPSDIRNISAARDPVFQFEAYSTTGIVEWKGGPFTIKSISGYRQQNSLTISPFTGGKEVDGFFMGGEPASQFSQELQLNCAIDRLNVTAGAYYYREKDAAIPGNSVLPRSVIYSFFGLGPPPSDYLVDVVEIGGTIRTSAKAAFLQTTWEVIDQLSLTTGVRVSEESKRATLSNSFSLDQPFIQNSPTSNDTPLPPVTEEPTVTFHSTTPKVGIQYQWTSDLMSYASYSEGFKSGGYDVTVVAPAYKPEKLRSYEVGLKSEAFEHRLRTNLAAFKYNYSNLQVPQVFGTQLITQNAASARVYGLEASFDAVVSDAFRISASGSYLDAKYEEYVGPDAALPLLPTLANFKGNTLNNAPKFQAYVSGTYAWDLAHGAIDLTGGLQYSTKYYFTPGNYDLLGQGAFTRLNASVAYRDKSGWELRAFVNNLTDKTIRTSAVVNTPLVGAPAQGALDAPRTYGLEMRYDF
jgi:iron complex outermembrane recepter protein